MLACVRQGWASSPFGWLAVARTVKGIAEVAFVSDERRGPTTGTCPSGRAGCSCSRDDAMARDVASRIFDQNPRANPASFALDIRATPFRARVWAAVRAIPRGETRSYADIARAIGAPTAVRAVGTAVGANPVAVLVPCHRVVRADGELGGYRWGVERKRALLEWERTLLG